MPEVGYIDTSCLLKLLVRESDSGAVAEEIDRHERLLVSSLAELEARSQLLGFRRGGVLSSGDYRAAVSRLEALLAMVPFHFAALGGDVFDVAIAQTKARAAAHCRSLDRLHLGAMQLLEASVLLTTDKQQAAAARSLGFVVRVPK